MLEIGDDIWINDGPTVAVLGFHYPTRMAVIRLLDGNLFIWSPVALSDDLRLQIDDLGTVAHIVAPNSLHHMALLEWIAAYPDATVHAAPGLANKRKDIRFDQTLGQNRAAWADQIDQVVVGGNLITTEVVFFHRASGVVLFADLLQQFAPGWHRGWRGQVAKMDLMVEPEASVPRKFRMAFVNRRKAREALVQILDWPAEKVVMAHGKPVISDGQAYLKRVFRWLIG